MTHQAHHPLPVVTIPAATTAPAWLITAVAVATAAAVILVVFTTVYRLPTGPLNAVLVTCGVLWSGLWIDRVMNAREQRIVEHVAELLAQNNDVLREELAARRKAATKKRDRQRVDKLTAAIDRRERQLRPVE